MINGIFKATNDLKKDRQSGMKRFDSVADMEPLLPGDAGAVYFERSLDLARRTARLEGALHPITRRSVLALVGSMNSYYSNLIEGQRTLPKDIDRALSRHFSTDPRRRSLQQLHLAHVETQRLMEQRLAENPATRICGAEFLGWLHGEFYRRLPPEFHTVQDARGREFPVEPGRIRSGDATVGRHLPPPPAKLPLFLKRFADYYTERLAEAQTALPALAAAHHRLTWIHPFADGNGRVARLFTQATLQQARFHGGGLWSISRGLARRNLKYRELLDQADAPRRYDTDGRGYLSEKALAEFCDFFIAVAHDQVEFMTGLLDLENILPRIRSFAEVREPRRELPRRSGVVLRECFLRGEIRRGEVAGLLNQSPRTAQTVINQLLKRNLLASDSPKGPLRLKFPMTVVEYYFPRLFVGADERAAGNRALSQ